MLLGLMLCCWGAFSGRWIGLYRIFLLVPFAFSVVHPGDVSLSGGLGSRNAPNTTSPVATTLLDWQSSCSPLYFTHMGSEQSPESRPIQSCFFFLLFEISHGIFLLGITAPAASASGVCQSRQAFQETLSAQFQTSLNQMNIIDCCHRIRWTSW